MRRVRLNWNYARGKGLLTWLGRRIALHLQSGRSLLNESKTRISAIVEVSDVRARDLATYLVGRKVGRASAAIASWISPTARAESDPDFYERANG